MKTLANYLFAAIAAMLVYPVAAQESGEPVDAELQREEVKIEPYTGPPIFLPKVEEPVPATKVETRTVTTWYDEKNNEGPKVERAVTVYSDQSLVNDGIYREFYPDGQVFVEGQYANGDAVGEWNYYHANGQLAKKVNFVDGKADGVVELRRPDGSLEAVREFAEGKRNGTWKTFDETGEQQLSEENYADGKLDGMWQTWWENGKPRQQATFKQGQRDGTTIEWDSEGVKRAEVEFVDNKQDGITRLWPADGKVVEQVYKEGKLISTNRE